ncbi:glycosyltransferase family 4 protein [Williamsia sp. CHRR-6]|uniref:glycosyltransferase family 4 protein n=1 Tax=Williamsia sp. CHRR-6 TaxID=2835871 RepID=UPI001BDA0A0C|nr:glycosyltransferase family 4 protein [Williamsia sp. CHRR-6]MBT0566282.1 glycosyltransferase family 4 protein [Williamsia sp. CHRR-6]
MTEAQQRRSVLWASTSRHTRGGVSSVVNALLDTDLSREWDITHVSTHTDGSALRKVAVFVVGAARFAWLLVARRPALVHIHMASYGSFVRKSVLVWSCRVVRVPVVLHVHGAEFHLFTARAPAAVRRYIGATVGAAHVVVALGADWAARLSVIAPDVRVVVVPNSVAARPAVEQSAHAGVVVLFLGRLGDRKGTFDVLRAWPQVVAGAPAGTRLVVAGDGEVARAQALVSQLGIADSVQVTGWVDPAAVTDLVDSAHVLVLPSHDEGQPMAVLEAMAAGLAVVTTRVGGIPDLLDDDSARFVGVDDVESVTAGLRAVVEDEALRTRLGAAAHARMARDFDRSVVWRQIDGLYREVLATPAAVAR